MPFEMLQELDPLNTVIKVIGVGGGGGNAVEHMINHGAQGIEFIAANTDHQALSRSKAHLLIQLGNNGLGAGARPEVGAAAAEEARERIREAIRGANLLFITAGMGGGTGTGAAPVIAEIAKEMDILTVGVVTKPFGFEGARRMRQAEAGIENLKSKVDSMIVILNEKLKDECPPNATMKQCFETSNEVLYKACVGIAEIIHTPGVINVDFEDIKTVMGSRGTAIIGLATAKGPDRARIAAEKAIACPLLEGANLHGARGLLVYLTGDDSLTLNETQQAMEILSNFVHPDATIIYGSALNGEMGEELRVTVVATGMDHPLESRVDSTAFKVPDLGFSNSAAPIKAIEVPSFRKLGTPSAPHLDDTPVVAAPSVQMTLPTAEAAAQEQPSLTDKEVSPLAPSAPSVAPVTVPTAQGKSTIERETPTADTVAPTGFRVPTFLRNNK